MKRYYMYWPEKVPNDGLCGVYLATDVQKLARECLPLIEARIAGFKQAWPAPIILEQIRLCEDIAVKLRALLQDQET